MHGVLGGFPLKQIFSFCDFGNLVKLNCCFFQSVKELQFDWLIFLNNHCTIWMTQVHAQRFG